WATSALQRSRLACRSGRSPRSRPRARTRSTPRTGSSPDPPIRPGRAGLRPFLALELLDHLRLGSLRRRALGERRRADPVVLPVEVVLLLVAVAVVDADQLALDLQPDPERVVGREEHGNVEVPLASGPLDPASRGMGLPRQTLFRQVL